MQNGKWLDAQAHHVRTLGTVSLSDIVNSIQEEDRSIQEHIGSLYIHKTDTLGIEEVHRIQSFHQMTHPSGAHHMVSITVCERLTPEAQNALLKLCEEPPVDHILIFLTPFTTKLLPTLISRLRVHLIEGDIPDIPSFLISNLSSRLKTIATYLEDIEGGVISRHELIAMMYMVYKEKKEDMDMQNRETALAILESMPKTDLSLKTLLEAFVFLLP